MMRSEQAGHSGAMPTRPGGLPDVSPYHTLTARQSSRHPSVRCLLVQDGGDRSTRNGDAKRTRPWPWQRSRIFCNRSIVMACETYAQQLATLNTQKKQQEEILASGFLKGPGLIAAQGRLEDIKADIAAMQKKLDDCRANLGAPSRPFVAQVKDISCRASNELTKDEPYLLIASVDMAAQLSAGPVSTTQPQVHCFQVGPWQH